MNMSNHSIDKSDSSNQEMTLPFPEPPSQIERRKTLTRKTKLYRKKVSHQMDTDVAVVAGGTAGLAAAVAAAEKGARVIVFEKTGRTGGCGNLANGLFAVESRLQNLMQLPLTKENVFDLYMEHTHWSVDAKLVRTFINKSADTIDWLEKMGVEFLAVESHGVGNNYVWHIIKPAPGSKSMGTGARMMKILAERARILGVKFYLNTPVKQILKKDGIICGVIAMGSNGEEIQAQAKAVIIATGGFVDNPEWIKKYAGLEIGRDFMPYRIPGLTGDGIRMAWEVNAAESPIHMQLIEHGVRAGRAGSAFMQPNLVVNLSGERFINEEIIGSNNTLTANAIAQQKNKIAFSILDESTIRYYEEKGFDINTGFGISLRPVESKITGLDADIEDAIAKGTKGIYAANSLEELAEKTGINLSGLCKTLAEFNRACESGRDELFNRKPRYLRVVKHPKYYVMKLFLSSFTSLGGIRINDRTEVLDKEMNIIPGLYAAGADAESIYGDTYPITLPGSTMGFAINTGRIAGENAAEYIAKR